MSAPKLILASGSAIRRQILDGAGLEYEVIVKPVDEAAIKASMLAEGSNLRDIADALAEAKSIRVSKNTPGLVIGADQIMVYDNTLYDKPTSIDEARERLKALSGKMHKLVGAVVISENGQPVWRHMAETKLYMRELSDDFLDEYFAAEGESVLTSVGAYKFEGRGAQLFTKVEGDFFSILGLSLLPVLDYLRTRKVILS